MATGPLTNAGTLAVDAQFQRTVLAAMLNQARTVIVNAANEQPFSVAYADQVVLNPLGVQLTAAWVVATDITVATAGTAYTEGMILAAVATAWPFLAGLRSSAV